MALSIVMPALEMAQDTGKLLAWRKQEGDRVRKGEPLLEIETDKAVVEIEAPGDGILAAVTAHAGAVIPVGQTIAWLVQPGEEAPAAIAKGATTEDTDTNGGHGITTTTEAHALNSTVSSVIQDHIRDVGRAAGLKISPKARRLAKERGIDLATLRGSGPGGEIVAEDVLAARSATTEDTETNRGHGKSTSVTSVDEEPFRDLRGSVVGALSSVARLMAERTTQSWTSVPHFFLTRHVDATALAATRNQFSPITVTDLLVAIVAGVLAKHPGMNASWSADGIRLNSDINVAIAIAVTDAVVTGVVHHADRASVDEIAARRKALTERARAGRLQPPDITGGTFTLSNLGMYQIDAFTAIIVPPQAGILAVGAIADRVVAINGQPAVRPMVTITLSCDHRVVDGAHGAAFLSDLVGAIQTYST